MASTSSAATAAQSLAGQAGSIVLLGAGKMGGALLAGWMRGGLAPSQVVILEPHPAAEIADLAKRGARLNPPLASVTAIAGLVIAVKPQVAADILPGLKPLIGPATVAISIMAGKTLRFLGSILGSEAALIRAMPNTPAAIGRGITVAVPNATVSTAQKQLAETLLAATGAVEWVTDEALMDAVTAVSGSGPAYVFLLAEALAAAGAAAGLPPALAERLARATVAGSGELLHQSELAAATLRQNVTSPGGTTAAALAVLMDQAGLPDLMTKAVAAATRRSRELAG